MVKLIEEIMFEVSIGNHELSLLLGTNETVVSSLENLIGQVISGTTCRHTDVVMDCFSKLVNESDLQFYLQLSVWVINELQYQEALLKFW